MFDFEKFNFNLALKDNKLAKMLEHEMITQEEYDKLRRNYDQKRQRLEVLSDVEKNMVGYFSSVKSVMHAVKSGKLSGIHGTVADVISVDKKYGIAIETALGNALQNIIVENEETAKRCIRCFRPMQKKRKF